MRWSRSTAARGRDHAQPARDPGRVVRRAAARRARTAFRRCASIWARSADLLSPLLSAGFYYKTFMWPPSFWQRFYEPAIRAARRAGARAARSRIADRYLHHYAHCEVLVIGGGPAGLAAALAASADRRAGHSVRRTGGNRRIVAGGDRRRRSTASRAASWLDDSARNAGRTSVTSRCCRAPPRSAGSRQFHRAGGAGHRSSRRARSAPAARASVAGARGVGGAGGGRHRTAAGISAQRSARHHAGRRRAGLPAPLWRESRRTRGDRDDR